MRQTNRLFFPALALAMAGFLVFAARTQAQEASPAKAGSAASGVQAPEGGKGRAPLVLAWSANTFGDYKPCPS